MNRKEILEKILKDEPKGFRKKFLDNPKKALEESTGQKLGDWKVEIHRVPKKTIVFQLPEEMPSSEKMTQEMLENIAAGLASGGSHKWYEGCVTPVKTLPDTCKYDPRFCP
jgi:hypothetical protein